MANLNEDWRKTPFDGLVVESPRGDRLLALPIAVLEILRYAAVIEYRRGGSVHRMRVDTFLDRRQENRQTQATDVMREAAEQAANSASATIQSMALPSPTPPPAPGEGEQEAQEDPANIPLRVRKGGHWENVYVTRAQYDEYQRQGRIRQEMPEGEQGPQEGTEQ